MRLPLLLNTLKAVGLLILCASATTACVTDTAFVDQADGSPWNGTIVVGDRTDVKVIVDHPEIEGSSQFPALTLEPADTKIVRTEPGGNGGFLLIGLAPGSTTIHVTTNGYSKADFAVTVKATNEDEAGGVILSGNGGH